MILMVESVLREHIALQVHMNLLFVLQEHITTKKALRHAKHALLVSIALLIRQLTLMHLVLQDIIV